MNRYTCPDCSHKGPFLLTVTGLVQMDAQGNWKPEDVHLTDEVKEHDEFTCPVCDFQGERQDFRNNYRNYPED